MTAEVMDYQGQLLCERLYQIIIGGAGLIGFGVGYHAQSFWLTFLWCVGGLCLATLVCVPDWPFYNRHPLGWQPASLLPGSTDAQGQLVKDSNEKCGTCVCGMSIHGIGCDSHPDYEAAAAAAEAAGEQQPTAASNASLASPPPPVVEIQAIKVKSTKKGKQ